MSVDCPSCDEPCDIKKDGPVTVFRCSDCDEPHSLIELIRERWF